MTLNGDPYRILGLPQGAPLPDVKRAYRRLAKVHHPDTAGDAATQRFLVIQAAYEALVGADGRGRRGPGAARPAPSPADGARTDVGRDAWSGRGARAGRRPAGDATNGDRAAPPPGGTARDPDADPTRRRRRGAGRRSGTERPPDRATPGSTSYDYAEGEAFDPAWSGGSWYGQSSGTYWTINPKEYADPRKHGPEYQARGRRRDDDSGSDAAPPRDPPPADDPAEPTAGGSRDPATEPEPGLRPREPRPNAGARPAAASRAAADVRSSAAAAGAWSADAAREAVRASVAGAVPWPVSPPGRVALALIGWPPLGLALALAIGEVSGCGRFAASCVEVFSVGGWIGQLLLIAALILVPPLAAAATAGTVAVLAAAVPGAVVLSAAGGSRQPDAAGGLLLSVLGVAWAIGVGFAVLRRSRTVPR